MSKGYERREPYKEDCTKGSSMINPLNYKGDVLVQVWVDSRVLATLCRWLDKNGLYSKFMSQVVRRPLEVVAETLVNNGEVEMVDDTVEARRLLEKRFNVDLNRGGRGTKNVSHNIVLSERRGELSERLDKAKLVDDVNRAQRRFTNPLTQSALDKYNELFPESEENKIV